MSKIHPTAIIDPDAKIHESVSVGPFTIIDSGVEIGEGTEIGASIHIYKNTKIGKNNRIWDGCQLGGAPQHLAVDPQVNSGLIIGDGNTFRETVNIHRSIYEDKHTVVGNNNYLMVSTHFGHDCIIGNNNTFANHAQIAGHVEMGDKNFVSALVGIHQFVRVGEYCMIGGLSKVVKDIPPYVTVDQLVTGLNNIGLKRNGVTAEVRRAIYRAYKIVYRSGLTTSKALEQLRGESMIPEVEKITQFIEQSQRGIIDFDYSATGVNEE